MSPQADKVLLDALSLSPLERAELVEKILGSISFPERKAIDELWADEAEDRINAHERGELAAKPASEVFAHIERGDF